MQSPLRSTKTNKPATTATRRSSILTTITTTNTCTNVETTIRRLKKKKKLNAVLYLANELMNECLKCPTSSSSPSSSLSSSSSSSLYFNAADDYEGDTLLAMASRVNTNNDSNNMLLTLSSSSSSSDEKMMIHQDEEDRWFEDTCNTFHLPSFSYPTATPTTIHPTPINEHAMKVVPEVKLGTYWNPQDETTATLITGLFSSSSNQLKLPPSPTKEEKQPSRTSMMIGSLRKRPYVSMLQHTSTSPHQREIVGTDKTTTTRGEEAKLDFDSTGHNLSLLDIFQGGVGPSFFDVGGGTGTQSMGTSAAATGPPPDTTTIGLGRRDVVAPSPSSVSSSIITNQRHDQWNDRYHDLVQYYQTHGDCLVPNTWPTNQPLSEWVKRQRYQYKLKMDGRPSYLSDHRMELLNSLGFIWNMQRANWDEKLKELVEYKVEYGHCNVPSIYPKNRQLGIWVRCQRRQYRLYMKDPESSSGMSDERIQKLHSIGFVFELRRKLVTKKDDDSNDLDN